MATLPSSMVGRCCARSLRSRTAIRPSPTIMTNQFRRDTRRWESNDASSASPKITQIVDQIGQLSLLETSDLVATLKKRLNIPDTPMGFAAAGTAPAPAAAAAAEEEEAPVVAEKTLFTITLKAFDTAAKPKVIKEIKSLLGLSLVDSKKFVESAPKVMKEGVPKEESEKIIETMKQLGAEVTMD